jgi:diacylglycerol O-acyltransferase / wax synthase
VFARPVEARAPRTSINQAIGAGRRLVIGRSRLDEVRQIAHARDATVNDVLMAATAGGLRDLLRSRTERIGDVVLRAYVAVSLRGQQPGEPRGNLDGLMSVSLPIGVAEPVRRLRLIAAETAESKERRRIPAGALLRNGVAQRAFCA